MNIAAALHSSIQQRVGLEYVRPEKGAIGICKKNLVHKEKVYIEEALELEASFKGLRVQVVRGYSEQSYYLQFLRSCGKAPKANDTITMRHELRKKIIIDKSSRVIIELQDINNCCTAGFVSCRNSHMEQESVLLIDQLSIAKDFQRNNYGTLLMSMAKSFAQTNGSTKMVLYTDESTAHFFSKKIGMRETLAVNDMREYTMEVPPIRLDASEVTRKYDLATTTKQKLKKLRTLSIGLLD